MFGKKLCKNCEKKIDKNYDFCPYCGKSLEDWGMLGKNDSLENEPSFNSILRGINGGMLGKMLNSAMKMLEKEMQKEMQRTKPKTNVQLFINGKKINLNDNQIKEKRKQEIPPSFSKEKLKKISSLPKKEPKTNIRRFSDKVVYEIDMPGVKSIKDISIIKLENSIEIKALAKNKYYSKLIPINLPIINYEFAKGKLILGLEGK